MALNPRHELLFWLNIMKEHAVFLINAFDSYNIDLKDKAAGFEGSYQRLLNMARCGVSIKRLMVESRILTERYIEFKLQVIDLFKLSKFEKVDNNNYAQLVDHAAQEAKEFLVILNLCEHGAHEITPLGLLNHEIFWLKTMADHAKHIARFISPMEGSIVSTADVWSQTFHRLFSKATQLELMFRTDSINPRLIYTFTDEIVREIKGFKDFKQAARSILETACTQMMFSSILADHLLREAEYFWGLIRALGTPKRTPVTAASQTSTVEMDVDEGYVTLPDETSSLPRTPRRKRKRNGKVCR